MEGSFKLSHGQATPPTGTGNKIPCSVHQRHHNGCDSCKSPPFSKGTSGTKTLSSQSLEPNDTAQVVLLKQRTVMAPKGNRTRGEGTDSSWERA